MLIALALLACADPPPAAISAVSTAPASNPNAGPPPGGNNPANRWTAFHATPTFQLVGEPTARRDILIISLDTTRADHLGVYGGRAYTPNLSAFAAQGALFTTAISHFPETCASHWSLMSGVLPAVHGNVAGHGGSLYTGPTAAEIASQAGYQTGAFIGGKTLEDKLCGLGRGFARYDDLLPAAVESTDRPADQVISAAIDWRHHAQGPTLTFVHLFDAHTPYSPAAAFNRYDPGYTGTFDGSSQTLVPYMNGKATPAPEDLAHAVALYDAELSQLDAALARLIADAGPDTVVVITADHGESFEHDYYFNHQMSLWDSTLHVPLIIRAPGLPAGAVVSAQVGLIDVLPTVLELAGLPADARMMGQSLVPLVNGQGSGRERVYSVTDPWSPDPRFAVRTPTTKVIWAAAGDLAYDLTVDPAELHPLPIPEALAKAKEDYDAAVKALTDDYNVTPPASRGIDGNVHKQLEILGYIDPQAPPQRGKAPGAPPRSPGRPPGRPPGQPPGPPNGQPPTP